MAPPLPTRLLALLAAAGASVAIASCGGSGSEQAREPVGDSATTSHAIEWVLVGTRRGHAVVVRPRVPQRECVTYSASVEESTDAVRVRMDADESECRGGSGDREERSSQDDDREDGDRQDGRRLFPNPYGLRNFISLHLKDDLAGRTVTGPEMAPLDAWQGGDSIGASVDYPRAVPDLTGLSIEQASALAGGFGSSVRVRGSGSDRAYVFRQWPRGGAADEGTAAQIMVRTTTQNPPPQDERYGPLTYLLRQ